MGYLRQKLSSNSLRERLSFTIFLFILLFFGVMTLSYFLLPEGILKNKNPLQHWETSDNTGLLTLQIFFYNLLSALMIAFASLFGKKKKSEANYLSVGYLVFFIQICINGIVVGTWSFSLGGDAVPFLYRITGIFNLAHRAGLWEMMGQLLITCALAHISTVLTSGKNTTTRKVRNIHLKKGEVRLLILGLIFILTGAVIESIAINSL